MPTIDDLRPACTIYNINGGRGTLTCFAVKLGEQKKLYGVTARHVLPVDSYCWLGAPFTSGAFMLGGPAQHIPGMDVLYFEIDDDLRIQLTKDNFIPVGQQVEPVLVWDPTSRRTKVTNAPSYNDELLRKQVTMPGIHIGSTQTWRPQGVLLNAPQPPTPGIVTKWTPPNTETIITSTVIAHGDSGGPVLYTGKMKYIGLISSGYEPQTSTTGRIVYLHDAFAKAGLALATWANRTQWQ